MHRRSVPALLLLIPACAGPHEPPQAQPAVLTVPADRVLIQFRTLSCVCDLGSIEYALLDLPHVSAIEWDVTDDRAWLIFLHGADRPTDEQIREAIRYTNARIKEIVRP